MESTTSGCSLGRADQESIKKAKKRKLYRGNRPLETAFTQGYFDAVFEKIKIDSKWITRKEN